MVAGHGPHRVLAVGRASIATSQGGMNPRFVEHNEPLRLQRRDFGLKGPPRGLIAFGGDQRFFSERAPAAAVHAPPSPD